MRRGEKIHPASYRSGMEAIERNTSVGGGLGTSIAGGGGSSQGQEIVRKALSTCAPDLLRTARRHSLCADDANDAYQRTLEILLRRADSLDPERAVGWLHTVCKHEAMAIRRLRQGLVSGSELDPDRETAADASSPEELVIRWERTDRAAEALKRLKPQELKALWLKASGLSYAEIAKRESWTYTKVNRCISEGRKSFLAHYAGIESGEECQRWLPLLSTIIDGEATAEQLTQARPHLRNCRHCRATLRELRDDAVAPRVALPTGGVMLSVINNGGGHCESGIPGRLTRLYDTLIAPIGERLAGMAVKIQLAGDALSGGKLVAVAASATAIAGGGVMANEQTTNRPVRQALTLRSDFNSRHGSARLTPAAPASASGQQRHNLSELRKSVSTAVDQEFGPERTAGPPAANKASFHDPSSNHTLNGREFDP